MWALLLLLLLPAAPPPAAAQAQENRLILKNPDPGSNPCDGFVQVYHDKKWGYVGKCSLSEADRKVACESAQCGVPQRTGLELLPPDADLWLENLNCKGSENHLWDCDRSKWSVSHRGQTMERLTCSHNLTVSLDGLHSRCAGRVSYSTDGGNTVAGYICKEGFREKEADVLCRSLGCGDRKEIPSWSDATRGSISGSITTKCLGTEDHLWQCAPKTAKSCSQAATVYCKDHKEVRLSGNQSNVCSGKVEVKEGSSWTLNKATDETSLGNWCQQMFCGNYQNHSLKEDSTVLTCSDRVRLTLTNHCFGTVQIERNGVALPVCAAEWSGFNDKLVCEELGCGSVLVLEQKSQSQSQSKTFLDDVKCSDGDASLWHCKSRHSLETMKCNKNFADVVCSESFKARLSDGPSRCAGRLELFFKGEWRSAQDGGWSSESRGTVCRHLKCGDLVRDPSHQLQFAPGSLKYLDKKFDCKRAPKDLFSCTIEDINRPPRDKDKTVDITCSDHAEVFFNGSFCGGEVQVKKSSKLYWLSVSADSWTSDTANAVCAQKRCGSAKTFATKPISPEKPLCELGYCGANMSCVFDCQPNVAESNPNKTMEVAQVTCTGTKSVSLTEGCWGFLNVTEEGASGGVCAEAWTDDNSKLLCQRLGCGVGIVPVEKARTGFALSYSSFHLLHPQQDVQVSIQHSTAVLNNQTCSGKAVHVVCTGSYRSKFSEPKDFCSGNVQLLQEGKGLSLCEDVVKNKNTANIICAQLDCGSALDQPSIPHYGPSSSPPYIANLQCPDSGDSGFHSCSASENDRSCSISGIRCSRWRQMVLLGGESSCSGVVFVYSEKGRNAVTAVGWTQAETDRLCKDLSCGDTGSHSVVDNKQEKFSKAELWNGSFNCSSAQSPKSLWECGPKENTLPPKENLPRLQVTCSAPPVVTLSLWCRGRAQIDGAEVCASRWDDSYSHRVCEELKCGEAVPSDNSDEPRPNSQYQHVTCERHHERLGQCQRYSAPCRASRLASVICTNSLQFRTSGPCGGDLEASFEDGVWKKVCQKKELPATLKNKLCKELESLPNKKCGASNITATETSFSLNCAQDHQDVRYCLSKTKCTEKPVQLFCKGYQAPTAPPPPPDRTPVIAGVSVSLILALAVAAVVILWLYLRRQNKSFKQLLPAMIWKRKKDLERADSEDYEDVPNEGAHRLRGLDSAKGSYTNVDELAPLAEPQRPLEDSDGADSYDDIGVSPDGPEELQTTAEVHPQPLFAEGEEQRPLSTEEGEDAQPEEGGGEGGMEEEPDLILGEDDYLVPPGAEAAD